MKVNELVHGVIWPAVAGSILWTFLVVAIEPHGAHASIWPRLFALLLVGVYLAIDWMDTEAAGGNSRKYSWLAEMSLAASLSTFAVATQFNAWWSAWPLAAAFAFAILGHSFGAWDPRTGSSSVGARATLAGINALGLVVLGLMALFSNDSSAKWSKVAAMAVVVVVYLSCRKKVSTWWPSRA